MKLNQSGGCDLTRPMKNLLVYINPHKHFDADGKRYRHNSTLVKIQIDNSLDLGWKKEDILLITNFPFSYNGVKATVLEGDLYCPFRPLSTKTLTVSYLLEKGMVEKGHVYWVHDFDAYQVHPFRESELSLDNAHVGFTDYGWSPKWCMGSYFFNSEAKDLFGWIKETIYTHEAEDERALSSLTKNNTNNINDSIKKLNITYNFGMRNIGGNYEIADKPLKVLHFHPYYKDNRLPDTTLNCFMYGKNELNMPLMSERLIKIFNDNGII